MNKENQILLEKLKKYLSEKVCANRYEHSLRTAQTAKELCLRFGEDAELGEIAGVAHDICKEMKSDLLLNLVHSSDYEISQIEKDKPSLLHGKASSVLLKNEFDGENTIRNLKKLRKYYPELATEFVGWLSNYSEIDEREEDDYNNKILFDVTKEDDYKKAIIIYLSGMTDKYIVKMYNSLISI